MCVLYVFFSVPLLLMLLCGIVFIHLHCEHVNKCGCSYWGCLHIWWRLAYFELWSLSRQESVVMRWLSVFDRQGKLTRVGTSLFLASSHRLVSLDGRERNNNGENVVRLRRMKWRVL